MYSFATRDLTNCPTKAFALGFPPWQPSPEYLGGTQSNQLPYYPWHSDSDRAQSTDWAFMIMNFGTFITNIISTGQLYDSLYCVPTIIENNVFTTCGEPRVINITYDKFRREIISVKECPNENLLHRKFSMTWFQWIFGEIYTTENIITEISNKRFFVSNVGRTLHPH